MSSSVANQAARSLVGVAALDRRTRISLRSRNRSGFRALGLAGLRSRSRSGTAIAGGFATDFTLFAAEQVFDQLENRAAIEFVSFRLRNFFTGRNGASLLANRDLSAGLRGARSFAAGFRSALASFASVNRYSLGFEQVRNVIEQVANRRRVALFLERLFANVREADLLAGRRTRLGTSRRTRLSTSRRTFCTWGTRGGLASIALAAVTVTPKNAFQKFKTEPLAAQGHAHQERSKNHFASH
jgi:hypothetical protein